LENKKEFLGSKKIPEKIPEVQLPETRELNFGDLVDKSSFGKATEDKERLQPDDSSWGTIKKEGQDRFFILLCQIVVI
jgi:hypothetical protein